MPAVKNQPKRAAHKDPTRRANSFTKDEVDVVVAALRGYRGAVGDLIPHAVPAELVQKFERMQKSF